MTQDRAEQEAAAENPAASSAFSSRRALLAAALAAGAATVATALGAPAAAHAAYGDYVRIGYTVAGTSTTTIDATGTPGTNAFVGAAAGGGTGLMGTSVDGDGVLGSSESGVGVYATGAYGVYAIASAGYGVYATSSSGTAIVGEHTGIGFGVTGISNAAAGGVGVYGSASLGTGVMADSTSGTALFVNGKAKFSRSGRVLVAKGKTYVDVTVTGGVTSTSLCFANLATYRSGYWVSAVRPAYPSAAKIRIYLNKALTTATYVSWVVLG